ncbi:nucleotidyltransferase family protein [Catenovulum adriaticum]|uniref:Nucleotidyltransferase family protein n=1 Tax=Catenovulum adriaticum TaxID=2984846 RepID=A0ABY7ASH7_9ALTE|nr:nucleotidyltransferase family protein [Catenovulum sp. TS8]WAJ72218.1 nucleotidyltransferase family protein [Catenovulum sp. TS8]
MIHLVLLAAGQASRFGQIKQIATYQQKPIVQYQIEKLLPLKLPIILILGYQQQQILNAIPAQLKAQINIVYNSKWHTGMASSLGTAVKFAQLNTRAQALLFMPLDLVRVTQTDIRKLVETYQKHPELICCSCFKDIKTSPAIFPKRYFSQISNLSGDKGAMRLIKNAQDYQITTMPNAEFDVDTPEMLAYLNELKS